MNLNVLQAGACLIEDQKGPNRIFLQKDPVLDLSVSIWYGMKQSPVCEQTYNLLSFVYDHYRFERCVCMHVCVCLTWFMTLLKDSCMRSSFSRSLTTFSSSAISFSANACGSTSAILRSFGARSVRCNKIHVHYIIELRVILLFINKLMLLLSDASQCGFNSQFEQVQIFMRGSLLADLRKVNGSTHV